MMMRFLENEARFFWFMLWLDMVIMFILALTFVAISTVGCTHIPAASTYQATGCVSACDNMMNLGCVEFANGKCVQRCIEYEAFGLDMHTGCLSNIKDCSKTIDCAK